MKSVKKSLLLVLCAVLIVAASVLGTLAYLTDQETVTNTFTVGQVQIDLNETDVDNDDNTKANDYHLLPGQTYTKDPTVTIKANSEPSFVRMFVTVQDYPDLHVICTEHHDGSADTNPYYFSFDDKYYYVKLEKFTTGFSNDEWQCVGVEWNSESIDTAVYEFRYVGGSDGITEKKTADDDLPALFETLEVPGWMDNDDLLALSKGYMYYPAHGAMTTKKAEEMDGYSAGYHSAYGYPFKITVRAEAIQAAGFDNADAAWAAFDAQYANS